MALRVSPRTTWCSEKPSIPPITITGTDCVSRPGSRCPDGSSPKSSKVAAPTKSVEIVSSWTKDTISPVEPAVKKPSARVPSDVRITQP
jgi:hypothetical protein